MMFVGHFSWRMCAWNCGSGWGGVQDVPLQLSIGGDDLLADGAAQLTHAIRHTGTLKLTYAMVA